VPITLQVGAEIAHVYWTVQHAVINHQLQQLTQLQLLTGVGLEELQGTAAHGNAVLHWPARWVRCREALAPL
jgi:hypothetical protein